MTWPLRPASLAAPPYRSSYRPRHADEVKLNHNEAPEDVPAEVKADVLQRLATAAWHRYDDPDAGRLRTALARVTGHPAAGIVVGHGANDVLHRLIFALRPDARLVLTDPDYYVYGRAAEVAGVPVVHVPLMPDDDGFALNVEGLLAASLCPAPVLILSQPNNPTGSLFAEAAIDRLLHEFPGPIVLDEAYLPFSGVTRQADLAWREDLLLLRTLSKAEALAGVRVGYALTQPGLVAELDKGLPPYPLGILATVAAEVALERQDIAEHRAANVVAERQRLARQLAELGVRVHRSAASFLLLGLGERLGAARSALDKAHLAVRDVSQLHGLAGCLRVSVGTPAVNDRMLAALAEAMR